jgi:hypothetical protein
VHFVATFDYGEQTVELLPKRSVIGQSVE